MAEAVDGAGTRATPKATQAPPTTIPPPSGLALCAPPPPTLLRYPIMILSLIAKKAWAVLLKPILRQVLVIDATLCKDVW